MIPITGPRNLILSTISSPSSGFPTLRTDGFLVHSSRIIGAMLNDIITHRNINPRLLLNYLGILLHQFADFPAVSGSRGGWMIAPVPNSCHGIGQPNTPLPHREKAVRYLTMTPISAAGNLRGHYAAAVVAPDLRASRQVATRQWYRPSCRVNISKRYDDRLDTKIIYT